MRVNIRPAPDIIPAWGETRQNEMYRRNTVRIEAPEQARFLHRIRQFVIGRSVQS